MKKFLRENAVIIIITLIYTIVSFTKLGTLTNPQTFWKSKEYINQSGVLLEGMTEETDSIDISIKSEKPITVSNMKYFFGPLAGEYNLYISTDGTNYTFFKKIEKQYEFAWYSIEIGQKIKSIRISSLSAGTYLGEIMLYDENNEKIELKAVTNTAMLVLDESDTVPDRISYLNSAYFDEIYFARTAYENVHNMDIYEWTHPPLGKLIMAIPIAFLGMNTFAYRLMGNIAGILMIIVIYAIAKLLFKDKKWANLAAIIMACDGMHFSQTRIGTVDSFLVLFIMLAFLFMFRYVYLSKEKGLLKSKLKNLCFSGIFMGMAMATKWTGCYAAVGLAIVFFIDLYRKYCINKINLTKEELLIKFTTGKRIDKTLKLIIACCIIFFIWVPIIIYVISYLPFYTTGRIYNLDTFLEVQENMYNYHSKLDATHPFTSKWYTWPIMQKPVWYAVYDYGTEGYSTISGMGNPIIWWIGIIGIIYTFIKMIRKLDKTSLLLIIPIATMFLPYVFIPRIMFLYHYFPVVPFMMLSIVNLVKMITEKIKNDGVYYGIITIFVLSFIYFYPVVSGIVVSQSYIESTKWLKTWYY